MLITWREFCLFLSDAVKKKKFKLYNTLTVTKLEVKFSLFTPRRFIEGSRGKTSVIINLYNRWRCVGNLRPYRSNSSARHRYSLNRRLGGPRAQMSFLKKTKILCLYLDLNSERSSP